MVTIITRPDWPGVVTAIGTVAVAVVAVGVALYAERRASKRLSEEHKRSDRLLAEERALSEARLREERQLTQDREQLAEAYAVRVLMVERSTGPLGDRKGEPVRLAAIVINKGRYPISRVEAKLRLASGGSPSLVEFEGRERVPGAHDLDPKLLGGMGARLEAMMHSSLLAPWDLGIRFESDPMFSADLPGAYPVVRWADRWGTCWEHRRGEIRQVVDGEDWSA